MVNQSTPSEIVYIRKGNPKRVHVQDDVHYFYWDLDLYKRRDYEPVKVYKTNENLNVITRYHWDSVIIFWTSPKLVRDKPVVDFYTGFHTPFVITERSDVRFRFRNELSLTDKLFLSVGIPLVKREINKRAGVSVGKIRCYKRKITEKSVPKKYKLMLKKWKTLMTVGEVSESGLPSWIRDQLY